MAKRFTDTELDDKEWFMTLTCRLKCAVQYIFRKCDAAGVWEPNYILAAVYIGENGFKEAELLEIDGGQQFVKLQNGKIFLPGFIKFQYGKLSKDCKPHLPVYRILQKNGIDVDDLEMSEGIGKSHCITVKQRELVLWQDKYTCCYCGKIKEERNLVIDHVVPRKKGGADNIENIVACCAPCNSKKSDYSVYEFCEKYNLDFETIEKRIHERVSKRVSNTLKEKDKDKDKEKEQEKDFGKSENLLTEPGPLPILEPIPQGIVPDMLQTFVDLNQEYPVKQDIDFPALREVGDKIVDWLKLPGDLTNSENQPDVRRRWGELVTHAKAHSLYQSFSISQINKHFQSICQSFNSGKNGAANQQPYTGSNTGKLGTSEARVKKTKEY